jgi:hypothetical protein
VVTAAVGDAIRSKIGKLKKKTPIKRPARKRLQGNQSTDQRTNPMSGRAAPGGDHGGRPPRGRCGAEAWAAATRVWTGLV